MPPDTSHVIRVFVTNSQQNDWINYMPVIAVICTLLLFILDRLIAAHIRKNEIIRNWYLKVLVEPNIERITVFYDECEENYKSASDKLSTSSTLTNDQYLKLQSEQFEIFTDHLIKLKGKLITPLVARYFNLSQKLDETLRNYEDDFTSSIDNKKLSKDDYVDFELRSAQNKAQVFNLLYEPLN